MSSSLRQEPDGRFVGKNLKDIIIPVNLAMHGLIMQGRSIKSR